MKNPYVKIFVTLCIIFAGVTAETYTVNLANEHDDLLSVLGLLLSFVIVLLMIWGTVKLYIKPKKTKKWKEKS